MTDIEITKLFKMEPIKDIANGLGIDDDDIIQYGKYKAKISSKISKSKGKLILVTAMSPSPYGEGKTTVSIGLNDAICKLQKKSILVLREPSLGPVFGMKGGATGGGYAQVVPMEDINLHFTGDFHAITSANNLLSAAIDNHIFQGNSLKIDTSTIRFQRCLDINDRSLRNISMSTRDDNFKITAASEVMTIFCLASDLDDLKRRLGNILIGYNCDGKPLFASNLHVEGAMTVLLKDAFIPNLVQTLENNPVIIHGGPFANIAHGCNSIIATRLGLSLADFVVTEAGFGADLGAEKFFDITCRKGEFIPDCAVLVVTTKAIKYNAFIGKESIFLENTEAIKVGLCNVGAHIDNLKKYGVPLVVTCNRYSTDSDEEVRIISEYCLEKDVPFTICNAYSEGSDGAVSLATTVLEEMDKNISSNFNYLYDEKLSITEKIEEIAAEIYHAASVIYTDEAMVELESIRQLGVDKYPVCIAKTQYSLSDDPKLLGDPSNYTVTVKSVQLYNGAEFVTVLLSDIMTMPGLPKVPNYEKVDLDENGNIVGIF